MHKIKWAASAIKHHKFAPMSIIKFDAILVKINVAQITINHSMCKVVDILRNSRMLKIVKYSYKVEQLESF